MLRRVVTVVPCSSPAAVGWRTPHQWLTCWLGSHIAILCRISPPKPGASSMHLGEKLPCDAKERDADALSFYGVTMFASLVSCANSGTKHFMQLTD